MDKVSYGIVLVKNGFSSTHTKSMNDVELNWYIHYMVAHGYGIDIQVVE